MVDKSLMETLAAVCDAFLPEMDSDFTQAQIADPQVALEYDSDAARAAALEEFCRRTPSNIGVPAAVAEKLKMLPPDAYDQTLLLLRALGTTPGNLLITGYAQPFSTLTPPQREAAMQALAGSRLSLLRKAFRAFKALSVSIYMNLPNNPTWPVVGYSGPRVAALDATAATPPHEHGYAMLEISEDTTLEVDVVIVGSGCGGGVMAAELSAAGLRCAVLEKGNFVKPADMVQEEAAGFDEFYERGGLLTTEDGAITVLAGESFGGGTSINWSCCLPTPGYVRDEWAEMGLNRFVTAEYQRSLEHVTARIGASAEGVTHNASNRLLIDGCTALGYDVATAPQNLGDMRVGTSGAGFISLGDRYGNKKSVPVTFMEDAAATGNCVFVDRCWVERVTYSDDAAATGVECRVGASSSSGGQPAAGAVPAAAASHALVVRARAVVVACGSVHSPALLLRSGVANAHIGKNLRLHPVTGVWAVMGDGQGGGGGKAVRGGEQKFWTGAPMTAVSNVGVAGAKGDFYGYKLECPSVHPGLGAAVLPWDSASQFRRQMLQMPSMNLEMVLSRDKGSGRVVLDAYGQPRIHYTLSTHDRESLEDGVDKMLRIAVAAGATEVGTLQQSVGSFVPAQASSSPSSSSSSTGSAAPASAGRGEGLADPAFGAYCAKVRAAGVHPNACGIFSAHQMGTCRMGADPGSSVVDPDGQSWQVPGLYVADASVFPTPSGANPMVTTLSIAHMLAQGLKRKLGAAVHAPTGAAQLEAETRARL